jgi:hypothetical protein
MRSELSAGAAPFAVLLISASKLIGAPLQMKSGGMDRLEAGQPLASC